MTRRILLASAIALLATAATAAARPSLVTDQACYAAEADVMRFTGQGFTPGAAVSLLFAHNGRMGDFMATADAAGAFVADVRAPRFRDFDEEPPSFALSVTANDQAKFGPDGPIGPPEESFALADVRIAEWAVDVGTWNDRAPARRRQRVKLVTTGWTSAGDTLYIHYLRGGKLVHSERVGALTGPCGGLTKRIRAFGFAGARPGVYAVRFSATPRFDRKAPQLGYRRVRLR